ncbi:hypothetical protein MKW94_029307 [Papaver nudicaule]|uniref:nucleoside-diphosphate kinase n=1 Tax=Papaver nudicaule TaxID=74823 RepID=A0AA41S1Y1_PAPNU|nr:hypothetical protein [Papaver nudicaule]
MIDQKQQLQQKTFVLGYPGFFSHRCMGDLVSQFEKSGLNITEMICMEVSEVFAGEHIVNIGWDPEAYAEWSPEAERTAEDEWNPEASNGNLPVASRKWVDYLASDPVVAMVVEGDDSVDKVLELTSKKQLPFWVGNNKRPTVYASKSGEQAERDISLWFRPVSLREAVDAQGKKVVFMLPKGLVYGPQKEVEDVLQQDESYALQEPLKDNFFMEYMSVFLIKPLAFRKRCVGEILDAIEFNSFGLRGLKLVKKAEHPSKAWLTDSDSDGETDCDEYGVAVVAYNIKPCLKILPGDIKKIHLKNEVFEIGSNYLHKSDPGDDVLEAAAEFFEYGFTAWAYPNHALLFGCMFQASFVGLDSLP